MKVFQQFSKVPDSFLKALDTNKSAEYDMVNRVVVASRHCPEMTTLHIHFHETAGYVHMYLSWEN